MTEVAPPADLAAEFQLHRVPVQSRPIGSLPSWERRPVEELALTDAEHETLTDLSEQVFGGRPHHQVGGFPMPVQGDSMELECQLASNGIYIGTPDAFRSPAAEAIKRGAEDWRLLLQVDSDDDLGAMWGDVGTLYFWIREADARAGNFDRVWLVLECC